MALKMKSAGQKLLDIFKEKFCPTAMQAQPKTITEVYSKMFLKTLASRKAGVAPGSMFQVSDVPSL